MWIQPKTAWKPGDFFNVEDYNRIKANLQELRNLAITMYPQFTIHEMGADKTYQDYSFYADEITLLEENLAVIREHLPYWKGETKTWYDNDPFWDYKDLNRIENACLTMYESLMGQSRGRPRLRFTLGRGRCAVCR